MILHAKNAITQDDVGRSVKIADRAKNEVVLRSLVPLVRRVAEVQHYAASSVAKE